MGDSDRSKTPTAASRHPKPQTDTQAAEQDKLDIARRFLEEDHVKSASREKKIEFLRSKNIAESDIQQLLGDPNDDKSEKQASIATRNAESSTSSWPQFPTVSRPPVVTYPEFLSQPDRPQPLVTTNGLINTLCAFAGLSTILYGASQYVVAPMVDNLTDARSELHETASRRLDDITAKLESAVSVVPPRTSHAVVLDDADDDDDPSEMFHRDVGTQTAFADDTSSGTSPPTASPSAVERHASRLADFSKALAGLKDDFHSYDVGVQDVKTTIDVFRDELDAMTYGSGHDFVGGFDMYGKLRRSEPDDEIRKARDNIRRIKGVLLSTRNFPTSMSNGTS